MKNFRTISGFSLIELCVVLVIVGLLTGAILGGRTMIRNSELRAVATEAQTYTGAMKLFKDKYLSLPGDMPNATTVWGVANAVPATCRTTVGVGTQTCDGDGDGTIEGLNSVLPLEIFRFWQQLRNAGLIEGDFNGVQGAGGMTDHTPGVNCPASAFPGGGVSVGYIGTSLAANADYFPYQDGHVLIFGAKATNGPTHNPLFTAEDALSIDSKIDDGRPAYGSVQAWKNTSAITPGCTTTDVNTTAAYSTTGGRLCNLIFVSGL